MRAPNPAQRFDATFSDTGVHIGNGAGLTVAAYGRAGATRTLGPAAPVADANRVTYRAGGMSYSYANGPLGLEQTFTIPHRPAGAAGAPLTIAIAVGNAHPTLAGGTVTLHGPSGQILRYGQLGATDARGRSLPARLAVSGNRILLQVDDRGAAYPIRIDPFVAQGAALAGTSAAAARAARWRPTRMARL